MIFLVATTFLTVYSGASYLIRNRKVFVDKTETVSKVEAKEEKVEEVQEKNDTQENKE